MRESLLDIESRFLEFFWFSGDYAIWSDGRVSVSGDCQMKSGDANMERLPIRFREVGGIFKCDSAGLTSLEGAPEKVGGDFICPNNPIVRLGTTRLSVGGDLYLQGHQIGQAFWKDFENAVSMDGSIFCSVLNVDVIRNISARRFGNNQGIFYAEWRHDLPVLKCISGDVGLFCADAKVSEIISKYHKDPHSGLLAARDLLLAGFKENARY